MSLQASFYECFELFAAAVQKQADSAIESEEIEEPEKSAIAAASQVRSLSSEDLRHIVSRFNEQKKCYV